MSRGDDVTLPDASGAAQVRSLPAPRLDLGDRYELGETLGKGGMGEVKLARDGRIHRDVAVKLMRGSQRDEVTVGRFFREARVQGVLEHPAVVPVHDLGIDGDGNPYFVMKRLAGTTLADVIATTEDEARTVAAPPAAAAARRHLPRDRVRAHPRRRPSRPQAREHHAR